MSYELLYMKGVVYVTDIYDCLWFLKKKKYRSKYINLQIKWLKSI